MRRPRPSSASAFVWPRPYVALPDERADHGGGAAGRLGRNA